MQGAGFRIQRTNSSYPRGWPGRKGFATTMITAQVPENPGGRAVTGSADSPRGADREHANTRRVRVQFMRDNNPPILHPIAADDVANRANARKKTGRLQEV